MAKKRKSKDKVPIPILIIVYAALLYTTYTSLSTLTLAIWGKSVLGTVDVYGSQLVESGAEGNRSRVVTKGYWFMDGGKVYRGRVIYSSDEAWPSLKGGETRSESIRYLSFFPYINKPAMLSDFGRMGEGVIIYHILSPFGCVFLLWIVIRANRDGKKKKNNKKKAARKHIAESATHRVPQIIETRSEMDMFCHNCGNKLPEGAAFCSNCGTKAQGSDPDVCSSCGEKLAKGAAFCASCGARTQVSASGLCTACGAELPDGTEFCINCGTPVDPKTPKPIQPGQAATFVPEQGRTGLVGFSDMYNHPEIQAAMQKNKKFGIGCMWVLVFVPLIGFPIAGLLMDDFPFGESVVVGVFISIVMLIFSLLSLRRSKQPIWEGVVVNKYSKEKYEHRDSTETYTEFTTVITTDAGKKKTIVEKNSRRHMYDYLSVGDRVRFYPKLGTYEKYDKSRDRIIYCNICSMMNPIQNDRCKRCNNLLFK